METFISHFIQGLSKLSIFVNLTDEKKIYFLQRMMKIENFLYWMHKNRTFSDTIRTNLQKNSVDI